MRLKAIGSAFSALPAGIFLNVIDKDPCKRID